VWHARQARDTAATQRLLSTTLARDSACVDIGAHQGEFLRYFLEHAPHGNHIAIEALPSMAAELRRSFPQVHVVEAAIADRAGTAIFYHAIERPGWSGLQRQDYPSGTAVEELSVTVDTLDDVVPDTASVDFVKIDVEGAELGVLRGMPGILRRGVVVLFEHAIIHARSHGTTPDQVFAVLDDAGYEIRSLDGRGPHGREEFHALCVFADSTGYGRSAETNWVARPR